MHGLTERKPSVSLLNASAMRLVTIPLNMACDGIKFVHRKGLRTVALLYKKTETSIKIISENRCKAHRVLSYFCYCYDTILVCVLPAPPSLLSSIWNNFYTCVCSDTLSTCSSCKYACANMLLCMHGLTERNPSVSLLNTSAMRLVTIPLNMVCDGIKFVHRKGLRAVASLYKKQTSIKIISENRCRAHRVLYSCYCYDTILVCVLPAPPSLLSSIWNDFYTCVCSDTLSTCSSRKCACANMSLCMRKSHKDCQHWPYPSAASACFSGAEQPGICADKLRTVKAA